MKIQEFRQAYLQVQDSLGNNLQSLTIASSDFSSALEQVVSDYRTLNEIVDNFLSQQENHESRNSQDWGEEAPTS